MTPLRGPHAAAGTDAEPAPGQQPAIADVLGITYPRPVPDATGWADVFADPSLAPAPPSADMFAGPLGDLTRAIAPHVPWDPIAFHCQALAALGSYLGYDPHVVDGANARRPNLFLAVVGGTASGKGSSWAFVDWLLGRIDPGWRAERVITAVGSGEGLLSKITDPVFTINPRGDEVLAIPGSPDKRVLYVEEELGALFNKMVVQESVEKTITKAWDSGALETTTKKESMRCATPHVSIVGHITPDELYDRLDKRLMDNGFSNRWLYVLIKRTAVVARPPAPEAIDGVAELADRVAGAVRTASEAMAGQVDFTPAAADMFAATHEVMSRDRLTGAMGKQAARWAPQLFKLALIYAAVGGATRIDVEHLAAARATWAYAHRSAAAFFTGMTGNEHADRLLAMWRDADFADLTLTDIDEMFSKHMSAHKRAKMLDRLARDGLITRATVQSAGGGRPATVIRFAGPDTETAGVRW